jgi:uncharacterized protein
MIMTSANTVSSENVKITFAADNQAVYLTLREDPQTTPHVTSSDVLNELASRGVTYGIKQDIIEITLEFYMQHGIGEENLLIAEGKPAVPGENGRIEYLVKEAVVDLRPMPDGSIDYRETNSMTKVKKGQPVARCVSPSSGIDGMDVLGKVSWAKHGQPAQFPKIANTEIDRNDPALLVSTIDGCVVFKGNSIEITACCDIRGNVDFSTGNVRFEGSVNIGGDVKSGFEVVAAGSVTVHGVVEDATIRAGGDVIVKSGFIGSGKGLITSGHDVKLGFIRNQKVVAEGTISVEKEALDASLHANKAIIVRGSGLGLAGGRAFAKEAMVLSKLGTEAEIKTELRLGNDPELARQIEELKSRLADLSQKSAYFASQLREIENSKKKSKDLFTALIDKMEKVMDQKTNIDIEAEKVQKQLDALVAGCKPSACPVLKVLGNVFPGTVLVINDVRRVIDQPLKRRLFEVERGTVGDSYLSGI